MAHERQLLSWVEFRGAMGSGFSLHSAEYEQPAPDQDWEVGQCPVINGDETCGVATPNRNLTAYVGRARNS